MYVRVTHRYWPRHVALTLYLIVIIFIFFFWFANRAFSPDFSLRSSGCLIVKKQKKYGKNESLVENDIGKNYHKMI
ncbi:hypothetical protein STCU_10892 [Strigomonas culicis]|uniref:Uncharacterized protein n=1 Tax=Strigomonas culicis TaxID=28005 RepID=S9TJB5_9TRYP|nr:hypothetical protein STCU_10892 [Strigomonas culicis]|eukprot:EPY16954.1 hypothetical protein STCU_10892 [Strigomonas culicis]